MYGNIKCEFRFMEITKICQFCGNKFFAKKTTTKCCSDDCSKKFYKLRKRNEKLGANQITVENYNLEEIQKKDYLSIKEVMLLLDISRTSIYRMLKDGRLTKIEALKAVRIRRVDIDYLFTKKIENKQEKPYVLPYFSEDNYYTINQVLELFDISSGSFYSLCKKHQIPKIPKGKNVFVPKDLINSIFENVH